MSEIKFRGRRTHDKEWIFGNLVIDNSGNKHIVPFDYFEEDGHHLRYDDDTDKPVFFDQETIGQFTGLHDKNGKEIYEGDVLSYTGESVFMDGSKSGKIYTSKYKVIFKKCGFAVECIESELTRIGSESTMLYWPSHKAECIGNIHES